MMLNSWQCGLVLIATAGFICVQAFVRYDLNGDVWTITENTTNSKAPAKVPGTIYTALLEHGDIGDPLFRDNDIKYAWIGNVNWTYSRNFSLPDDVANSQKVWLICDGLDTIATVLINGKVVGRSEDMFVRYAFDVTGIVKTGLNFITVHFNSAVKEAAARALISGYRIPVDCPSAAQKGQCHVNQIRKEQCSFSWDWGPSFPTQGIWKPIYIDAYNNTVIREVSALVKKVNSQWHVDVEVEFDVNKVGEVTGQVHVNIAGLNLSFSQDVTVSATSNSFRFNLPVPTVYYTRCGDLLPTPQHLTPGLKTTQVALWWPRGYGDQTLFDVNVIFTSGADTSSKSLRIGFRTVELVQDPVSNKTEHGLSFYFRVNGIPIFLKGSNWIPADSFKERITLGRLRFLLESAANVSINSLRVWGGGIYESDEFYQLCDELGIMIWQDLMFSVSLYPTYPAFLNLVTTEIAQQVRRLKSHVSIICWAGNNENESAMRQNWFQTSSNYDLYYKDYVTLYVKTIKPIDIRWLSRETMLQ